MEKVGAADQVDRMGVGVGSMFIGLGLVGSALAGVFKILTSFSGKVDAIGAEFGAFGVQELAGPITAAEGEAIMMGKSLEDVISLTSQLGEDFGMSLEAAAGISKWLESVVQENTVQKLDRHLSMPY